MQPWIANLLRVPCLLLLLAGCSSGAANTDAMLDDLETICDKTISITNRMERGDMAALEEMAELTGKYQSLSEKLERARDSEWTTAHQQRYMRILSKYQSALSR